MDRANNMDYASHYLKLKDLLRKAHDMLELNHFSEAIPLAEHLIVEARLLRNVAVHRAKQ